MRILWVKADKLLPVQNGGNIRTYHVLRYLSARHELTFYSYYGGEPDPDYERELQRQLPGAVAVCTGKRELSGAARGLDYLAHLGAHAPYAVSRFADANVSADNIQAGSASAALMLPCAISSMPPSIFPGASTFPVCSFSTMSKAKSGAAMPPPQTIRAKK